jgi:outer membrane protein TolC
MTLGAGPSASETEPHHRGAAAGRGIDRLTYRKLELKAEEEKLRAGSSTRLLVLQAQAQRAAARSAVIRAVADYNESLAELDRVEGASLERNNIVLQE